MTKAVTHDSLRASACAGTKPPVRRSGGACLLKRLANDLVLMLRGKR